MINHIPFGFNQVWPPRYNWNIVESDVKHHNPPSIKFVVSKKKLIIHFPIHVISSVKYLMDWHKKLFN